MSLHIRLGAILALTLTQTAQSTPPASRFEAASIRRSTGAFAQFLSSMARFPGSTRNPV